MTVTAPKRVELFDRLEDTLNEFVFERPVEISCLMNALLSRTHLCILGQVGLAKTFLARTLVALTDLAGEDYFEASMGHFDDPAKIVGPHSMRGLGDDQFWRVTRRRLPRAKLALVSEVGRASTSILDYFLPILNERRFHEGEPDRPPTVELSTFICDSNTSPENSETLQAFWDRLTFHLVAERLRDPASVKAMLWGGVERLHAVGSTATPVVEPIIAWSEIVEAQAQVARVGFTDEVVEALADLRTALAAHDIYPSDRRLVDCLGVVQAEAWRAGRDEARPEDMRLLAHVLWNRQGERRQVQRLVYQVASPIDADALDLGDQLRAVADAVSAVRRMTSRDEIEAEGTIVHERLERIGADLTALATRADSEGRATDLLGPLSLQVTDLSMTLLALMEAAAT